MKATLVLVFLCVQIFDGESAHIVGLKKLNEVRANHNAKIIGGQPPTGPFFRYVAAIWLSTTDGTYFCGGSILSHQWILTAGQCVNGATRFKIQLGSLILNDPTAMLLAAEESVVYPDFDPYTLHHDIGLISLREPILFDDRISTIYLLPDRETDSNALLAAAGWGQTSDDNDNFSDELLIVTVTALSNEVCDAIFTGQIKESMICAEGNYNQGICYGDIGNALTETQKNGARMVVGIASFISSNGCESPDPSGFTRVYPYNDWIAQVTNSTELIRKE